jgi:putative tricarboxylic transport membrane protein
MIEGIWIGISTAFSGYNIFMVMIGCFAGTIIGMLPGLGPMSAIALMIPVTYSFDPSSAMILMAGVYYGAIFGGSTSSILINAPGVAGTVSSSFDGSKLYVTGIINAIADMGPSPGNIPIIVPAKQPIMTIKIL